MRVGGGEACPQASSHGGRDARLGRRPRAEEFLQALERAQVTPHVALRSPSFGRGVEGGEARAAMRRRQRRAGSWKSQRRRKVVDDLLVWAKAVAVPRGSRHVGRRNIAQQLEVTASAFNLVRLRRLLAA